MIAVHARAPFFMAQLALSRLRDPGRIINISSALTNRPQPSPDLFDGESPSTT